MSDDNELENGMSGAGEPGDDFANQELDASSSAEDDIEPRYDVSGAALGALDRAEEGALYSAAAVDPSVSAELAAMEAVAAELGRLAPVQLMSRGRSAGIRSRLVARAAATHVGRPAKKVAAPAHDADRQTAGPAVRPAARPVARPAIPVASRPSAPVAAGIAASSPGRQINPSHSIPFEPPSRFGLGRVVGLVALAAVVVIAAFGLYSWRSKSLVGSTDIAARDSTLESQVAQLTVSVAQKDSLIAALTGTHTRVIDLIGYNSVDPMARMFWDQKTQMFRMYASHVKQPASGKTYQVWLIARGVASPVSAGTFMPDSSGSAVMEMKHPMEPGTLRRVAVTEEPMGGMPTPTGPIRFTGVGK
jgi:hypothetical protein